MKLSRIIIPSFAVLVAAANHKLPRAIGDYCDAPEGTGTCQTKSNCEGISYPDAYCPNDPTDVQCCVPKKCSAPHTTSLCRKLDQGCPNGAFDPGNYCPGDESIQCCVQSSSPNVPSPAQENPCAHPKENECTFYPDCLESKVQCGPSGYPIDYGLKYCKKFTSAAPEFTSIGKSWITKTMLCLQRALIPYATGQKSDTCPALKDFAFATHPGCYVSSGVCALPPQDWEVIVKTVSLEELFGSMEAIEATLKTMQNCVEFYLWLVERGVVRVVEKVGDVVEDVWDKVTDIF